jgi:hypothetical protein
MVQKVHTVRWVASKVGTIKAVITEWIYLVSCGLNSDGNKAKGILKTLKNYRFIGTLLFLYDFLFLSNKLSMVFQITDLLFNQLQIHVNRTLTNLES